MIRPIALPLAVGLALAAASLSGAAQSVQTSGADESFPVAHSEPITLRILSGKSGQPLAHLHLILIGGYDQRDLHGQLFREEALTDAEGQARLSGQLANLPWLQVWVSKKPLCQARPRQAGFSVERIRRDGLSSPNRCGTAVAETLPGLFTVFVQSKEKKAPAKLIEASAEEPASASDATPTASSAAVLARQSPGVKVVAEPSQQPQSEADLQPPALAETPGVASAPPFATKTLTPRPGVAQPSMQPSGATPAPARPSAVAGIPAVAPTAPFGPETLVQPSSAAAALVRPPAAAEADLPASSPRAIPVAAALPAELTKFSAKNGLAAAAPASTEARSATASAARAGARESVRERTRRTAWQAEEESKIRRARVLSHRTRPVLHRAAPVSRRARLDAQRARRLPREAKPAPIACQPPPPAEKTARAAAWAKIEKSPATPPANAASTTLPSKPPAGAKPAAATPIKASAPPQPGKPAAPSKP